MKYGIVVFPGSNCDRDCQMALDYLDMDGEMLWYDEKHDLSGYGCIIIPGGFSYGDYLRAGAMAAVTPIMDSIEEFANNGGLVIGICNGFQVLLERGLLPGAMVPNRELNFKCEYVNIRVDNNRTPFSQDFTDGEVFSLPIAHQEGNYYYPGNPEDISGQVVFRYCSEDGETTDESNPNGSWRNVAGLANREGNVLGMMPHPERAVEAILGNSITAGQKVFTSIARFLDEGVGWTDER